MADLKLKGLSFLKQVRHSELLDMSDVQIWFNKLPTDVVTHESKLAITHQSKDVPNAIANIVAKL